MTLLKIPIVMNAIIIFITNTNSVYYETSIKGLDTVCMFCSFWIIVFCLIECEIEPSSRNKTKVGRPVAEYDSSGNIEIKARGSKLENYVINTGHFNNL